MPKHKVAVYGSLKQTFGNHSVLGDAPLLTVGITMPIFKMISLGGFPGLVDGIDSVWVEVYEVDDEGLQQLDWLEGYPSFYDRQMIAVMTEAGGIEQALIYTLSHHKGRYDDAESVKDYHPCGAVTWTH